MKPIVQAGASKPAYPSELARITAFVKRHPVPTYWALTFAISWGGILLVVGPGGLQGIMERFTTLGPITYLPMLAGPSIAGLLLTGLVDGRAGFRNLLARITRWRVGTRWYAIALLTAPLLATAGGLALSLLSPAFLPIIVTTSDKASLLLTGLTAGLLVGIFEELGWTGFAIPRLRLRHGVLATGLILGLVWGFWHFILFWESGSFAAALPLALLLVRLFSWLPAFRVLMVWVYDRTESLLVAMLMHASLVVSTLILQPGVASLTNILVWAASLWVVVAAVAVTNGGHLLRRPGVVRQPVAR